MRLWAMGLRYTWSKIGTVLRQSCANLWVTIQAIVVHPFNDPFVIAGQATVMVVSITLPISTSCWRQSAVEACFPVSVSRHTHSDRAWPSLPVSRPAPWMR